MSGLLTVCLVFEGLVGAIWEAIQSSGFCVVAAQIFRLSKVDAGEFLEVYKGVLPEYPELLNEFVSGPCVAMQITQTGLDFDESRQPDDPSSIQQRFRELVGPMDPVSKVEFFFNLQIYCNS